MSKLTFRQRDATVPFRRLLAMISFQALGPKSYRLTPGASASALAILTVSTSNPLKVMQLAKTEIRARYSPSTHIPAKGCGKIIEFPDGSFEFTVEDGDTREGVQAFVARVLNLYDDPVLGAVSILRFNRTSRLTITTVAVNWRAEFAQKIVNWSQNREPDQDRVNAIKQEIKAGSYVPRILHLARSHQGDTYVCVDGMHRKTALDQLLEECKTSRTMSVYEHREIQRASEVELVIFETDDDAIIRNCFENLAKSMPLADIYLESHDDEESFDLLALPPSPAPPPIPPYPLSVAVAPLQPAPPPPPPPPPVPPASKAEIEGYARQYQRQHFNMFTTSASPNRPHTSSFNFLNSISRYVRDTGASIAMVDQRLKELNLLYKRAFEMGKFKRLSPFQRDKCETHDHYLFCESNAPDFTVDP